MSIHLGRALIRMGKLLAALEPDDQAEAIRLLGKHYGGRCSTAMTVNNSERLRRGLLKNADLRDAIRQRDGDNCRYCGITVNWLDRRSPSGATYDHIDPWGENTLENVVVACHQCNITKNQYPPEQVGLKLLPPPSNPVSNSMELELLPPGESEDLLPSPPACKSPNSTTQETTTTGAKAAPTFEVAESIRTALSRCPFLSKDPRVYRPAFWQAEIRACSRLNFPRELLQAEAWCVANPGKAPKSNHAAFLHRWFRRAAETLEAQS